MRAAAGGSLFLSRTSPPALVSSLGGVFRGARISDGKGTGWPLTGVFDEDAAMR